MLNVLIVEDEEIIRRGMVKTIDWGAMGATVIGTAADGVEGLAALERLSPDVVITDIKMPLMDGLTMLKKAREEKIDAAAIILTSYAEFGFAREALRLSSVDYLLKPVDENALRDTMRRIGKLKMTAENMASGDNGATSVEGDGAHENEASAVTLADWDALRKDARRKNTYVARALTEIIKEYATRTSIEGLASRLGVSASYLSRKFKEVTGSTYGSLLAARRIEAATTLLHGDCRVYEVAETVGFNDYKNFCLVFKKYIHTTPKEYIKSSD